MMDDSVIVYVPLLYTEAKVHRSRVLKYRTTENTRQELHFKKIKPKRKPRGCKIFSNVSRRLLFNTLYKRSLAYKTVSHLQGGKLYIMSSGLISFYFFET